MVFLLIMMRALCQAIIGFAGELFYSLLLVNSVLAGLLSFKYGVFVDNDERALPGHHLLCRGVIPFITISKWRAGRAIEL
ncbi:hypothetical protein [Shewanella oncorhynchi]|uniref:hypothetical protein n=1 Tax=Shewanella oncorhynchi TaxID=2726434 RepID=UPI002E7ADCCA|nr:hypothetical protein [Shewanella oncorhynchi]WVI93188.1 hypothetical protein VR487_20645 [Shewanella oncorhynchi]